MESAENQEQLTQRNLPQQGSSDSSTLSKGETLKLLNDSIDRLEETIKGISENSAGGLPSSDSINDLLVTTQELAETVAPVPTAVEEVQPDDNVDTIAKPKSEQPLTNDSNISNPSSEKKVDASGANQTDVKRQKPKQNKIVMISLGLLAIAMIIVAVLWIWLPKYQVGLDSINQIPTIENISESKTNTVSEVITTPQSNVTDIAPENIPGIEETIADSESPVEIAIPQDLTAPGRARNLKIVTIEPELTFTPEQNLVAALQTKIANITAGYTTDFIDLIKVNLGEDSILVEVNDNWYQLNQSRRNKVSNAILERSRQLKFNHLKFQDSTGALVARNPVVGKNIIILTSLKENS